MSLPSDFNHIILIDEVVREDGWHAWCVPHGPLGAFGDRVIAVLAALEHDVQHGGQGCR